MGSKAFKQIRAGLEDAIAFLEGDHARGRVTHVLAVKGGWTRGRRKKPRRGRARG